MPPRDDPKDFAYVLQAKENAPDLLWRALSRTPGVWPCRKAAWTVEDLQQDVGLVYRQMGRKGLGSIENVGPRLAEVVDDLLSGAPISDGWCTLWK